MDKQVLDYVLVPIGFLIMVAYNLWLLYQVVNHPTRTVIGINAINRRFWVCAMMEDVSKNGVLAVQTLRNNIMASTVLASTAITLSSVIAVLMTNGGGNRSTGFVYGDRSNDGFFIKVFSLLVCFLVAFLLNVQSIRYFSHASILINVPYKTISSSWDDHYHNYCVSADYVGRIVNKGSYFWSLGLHAFYFSFPLFMWIFGPIPMFLCCIVLAFLLYFLDVTFDFGSVAAASCDREDHQYNHHHQEEEEEEDKDMEANLGG